MKLGKILGTLLVLLAMFVFVGCGEDPFEFSGDDFQVWVECYDASHENTDGIVYAHEGDSYTVSLRFGSLTWGNDADVKYEIHETSAGVVKSWGIDNGSDISYTVDIGFDMVNAGETKEFEYWATVGEYYTSEKIKVIVSNLEPLILVEQDKMSIYDFPGKVKNNEYSYVFDLISHNKNSVKFTKDTKIKQFTRLKGEENFTEETVTGIYSSRNYYPNGHVEVTFDFPEEYVNKEIELYYEYEGLKSNIITVKTLNYYFDIKVTDNGNHEITEENPLVVYADETQTLNFDISLFGPDGEIEGFEYTFTDLLRNHDIEDEPVLVYELPTFDEYVEEYEYCRFNSDPNFFGYDECETLLYFKYSIESEEYTGEITYTIDLGDNSYGRTIDKRVPIYYCNIPVSESAKELFIGDGGVWQKTDFSTTLTLESDGSLNYGTFKNDCSDDNYDFEGTYVINPLDYTAKATVELDGEENTFEISLYSDWNSEESRRIYYTAFTMDLSSLGLSNEETFVKKLTTTPKINGYYYIYNSENFDFTFMIDENSKSYYFCQRDYDDDYDYTKVERIGTFSTEGNIISFEPLGDPNFEGKKGIISNDGLLSIQFYDYENERDDVALLYKDKDISLELWLGNEESLFVFDRKAKTLLMNGHSATYVDTETGFKMKADNFYDENGNLVEYEGLTVEEDDVFLFDFTDEGGPVDYFVKVNFEEFDFDGTWGCDEGFVTIDSSKETDKVSFTVGDWSLSSLDRPYDHFGNFFVAYGQNGWMCSGAVSKSGKLYCAYRGENYSSDYVHSNLILTKQE